MGGSVATAPISKGKTPPQSSVCKHMSNALYVPTLLVAAIWVRPCNINNSVAVIVMAPTET